MCKLTDSDTLSAGTQDTEEGESDMPEEPESGFQSGKQAGQRQPGSKEISMPVGVSEEGQAIFAHVRFDAPLRKDYLKNLRGLLEALEKGLA